MQKLKIAARGHHFMHFHNLKKHLADLNPVTDLWPLHMIHDAAGVYPTHYHITDFVYHKSWRLSE